MTPEQLMALMAWVDERADDIARGLSDSQSEQAHEKRRDMYSAFGFTEGSLLEPVAPAKVECTDHNYAHERGTDWRCKHCGQEPPASWYDE